MIIIKKNIILDSVCSLSFYPSPHSHTLAGITANATKLYITQAVPSLQGDSRHQTRSGFSLLIIQFWGQAECSWILGRGLPFKENLVWCNLRASQQHQEIKQRKKNAMKRKKKKSMQISCFVKPICPRTGDIMGPCHACTGVKHASVPGVRNILQHLSLYPCSCTFISMDEVQLNQHVDSLLCFSSMLSTEPSCAPPTLQLP